MSHGSRRRSQAANGFRHLARVCGGSYKGGRRVYVHHSMGGIAAAIERERAAARREVARKASAKKKK